MEKRNLTANRIVEDAQCAQDIEYALERIQIHLKCLHKAKHLQLNEMGKESRHGWIEYWIQEVEQIIDSHNNRWKNRV